MMHRQKHNNMKRARAFQTRVARGRARVSKRARALGTRARQILGARSAPSFHLHFLFYNQEKNHGKKKRKKKRGKKNFFSRIVKKKLENPLKIVFSTRITRKWIF